MAKLLSKSLMSEFNPDWTSPDYQKEVKEAIERVAQSFRDKHEGDLVGFVYKFQIADGHAKYMVVQQFPEIVVAHLALDDEWQVESFYLVGLGEKELRAQIKWEKLIAGLHKSN